MNTPFIFLIGYDKDFKRNCKTGWGCGYVAIPATHQATIKHFDRVETEINRPYDKGEGYRYINKYFEGNFNQEITYTETEVINGHEYLVIGFDTAHHFNNDTHDREWILNETKLILDTINSLS